MNWKSVSQSDHCANFNRECWLFSQVDGITVLHKVYWHSFISERVPHPDLPSLCKNVPDYLMV